MEQAKNARSTIICRNAVEIFKEALKLASDEEEKEVAIKNFRTASKMEYLLKNEI